MIILTSFKYAENYKDDKHILYAIMFPPKENNYMCATALFPGAGGYMIHSKDYDTPEQYRNALMETYKKKREKVIEFLSKLDFSKNIVLLCYCNEESKKEMIEEKGYMLCHSGVVGQIIHKLYPALRIELDEDRKLWLPLELHPSYDPIKCSKCQLGGIEKCGDFKEYCYGPYIVKDGGIYSIKNTINYQNKEGGNVRNERKSNFNKTILCNYSTSNNRLLQREGESQERIDRILQVAGV